MKMLIRFGIGVLLMACSGEGVFALGESSTRAAGMGRTFTAVARNLDAVAWNPANLGLSSDRRISVALFSGGIGIGNSAITLADYNRFNGEVWDEADKQTILGKIPDDGVRINTAGEVRAMGVSMGPYAFRVSVFGSARGRLQKDPFDLLLFGNELDRVYRIDDTDFRAQGIWDLSVSAGYPIEVGSFWEFAVGMTLRYLGGIGFVEVQSASGMLTTQEVGAHLEGIGQARSAEGGTGFSVDLGASAVVNRRWSVGAALIHLGRMTWDREAKVHHGRMQADSVRVWDLIDAEKLEDIFNPTDETQPVSAFRASLPTTFRLGVARQSERLLLAWDWEQGLNNAPGTTTVPRISFGGEYRLKPWLPLRGGVSVVGRDQIAFSTGLGLGEKRIVFDMALQMRKGLAPNWASGIGVATELKVGF